MSLDIGGLISTYNYLVPAAGTTSAFSCQGVVASSTALDFSQVTSNSGSPFNPSGVVIDNTTGTEIVTVTVQQTGFTISCPVGAQMGIQYPAPAGHTVLVTANGANLAFVDYPVIPYQFLA